jgi:hypothetical protein
MRNLDAGLFDYLVAVLFDETFNLQEIWEIPHATIIKYARWSEHTHGHILTLRGGIMSDPTIKNLLGG